MKSVRSYFALLINNKMVYVLGTSEPLEKSNAEPPKTIPKDSLVERVLAEESVKELNHFYTDIARRSRRKQKLDEPWDPLAFFWAYSMLTEDELRDMVQRYKTRYPEIYSKE